MKLRRLLMGTCVVLGGLAMAVGTSGAAPTNSKTSEEVTAHCGEDGDIGLLINGGGGAPAFDVTVSNGRTYEALSLEGRSYLGSVDPEPGTEPVFSFVQDYGKRNGFPRTLTCTARDESTWGGVLYTTFYDVELAAK